MREIKVFLTSALLFALTFGMTLTARALLLIDRGSFFVYTAD